MLREGTYTAQQTAVGLDLSVDEKIYSTMPFSIMVRSSGTHPYTQFSVRDDQIPDGESVTVDKVDEENFVCYVTAPSLRLANLPEWRRLPESYTRTDPVAGDYYVNVTPVGFTFRSTDGTGFSLWYDNCLVQSPVTGIPCKYSGDIFQIPEDKKVHLDRVDGVFVIQSGVSMRQLESSSTTECIAIMLFGQTGGSALGAASVIWEIIKPWGREPVVKTQQDILPLIMDYVATASESENLTPQGAAHRTHELSVLLKMLLGPQMADFVQKALQDNELEFEDITYLEGERLFVPILKGGVSLYDYVRENYGVDYLALREQRVHQDIDTRVTGNGSGIAADVFAQGFSEVTDSVENVNAF